MLRITARTAFWTGAVVGLALGTRSTVAKEVCLETDRFQFGCFPCDLPIAVGWTGWTTAGEPCEVVPGPDFAEVGRGWWTAQFTLSASDTDPFDNVGHLPTVGELHLWMVDSGCGYGFGSTQLQISGDVQLRAYEAVAAGNHDWSPSADGRSGTLSLALGCTPTLCVTACPPELLGTFHVAQYGLESVPVGAADSRLQGSASSWGRIKGLYEDPTPRR